MKEPIEILLNITALKFKDSVYLFNPNGCIAIYTMLENGFNYSVTRKKEIDFLKELNFIYLDKNTIELTAVQFNEFVNQITVLQEQSHLIKPLVSFEDYIKILIEKHGLRLR